MWDATNARTINGRSRDALPRKQRREREREDESAKDCAAGKVSWSNPTCTYHLSSYILLNILRSERNLRQLPRLLRPNPNPNPSSMQSLDRQCGPACGAVCHVAAAVLPRIWREVVINLKDDPLRVVPHTKKEGGGGVVLRRRRIASNIDCYN